MEYCLLHLLLLSTVCRVMGDAGLGDQYVGCFENIPDQNGGMQSIGGSSNSLTIQSCISNCNRTYAGIQTGNTCLCGDDYGYNLPDEKCQVPCNGNPEQYCGGASSIGQASIYSLYSVCAFGLFGVDCNQVCHCNGQIPCNRITGLCPNGCEGDWTGSNCDTRNVSNQYIGCFNSVCTSGPTPTPPFAVKNPDGTTGGGTLTNTPDYCIGICAKLNYTYIGLQYGVDCHCGDKYDGYGQSNGCNYPCPGNSYEICGGFCNNSVYSVCPVGSYGLNCLGRCYCKNNADCFYGNGSCSSGCEPGWTGNSCNIRNCAVNNGNCDVNETCGSINLGYTTIVRCQCPQGYHRNNLWEDCTDLDECIAYADVCGNSSAYCLNTIGSFNCVFKTGYQSFNSTNSAVIANYSVDTTAAVVGGVLSAVIVGLLIVIVLLVTRQRKISKSFSTGNNFDQATVFGGRGSGEVVTSVGRAMNGLQSPVGSAQRDTNPTTKIDYEELNSIDRGVTLPYEELTRSNDESRIARTNRIHTIYCA